MRIRLTGQNNIGMETLNMKKTDKQNCCMEKCVICGKETEYSYDVPINERKYYSEGAGQLCEKCYIKLYVK